jgi:hypothetical protein
VTGNAIEIVENVAMGILGGAQTREALGILGGAQTREALGAVDGAQTLETLGVAAPCPAVAVHAVEIQVAETDADILAAITIPEILGLAQAAIIITGPDGETMVFEVAQVKSREMIMLQ